MKSIHIVAALASSAVFLIGRNQRGFGLDFVVAADSIAQDGNTYSVTPAIRQPFTIRYQQVYAASEFGVLTNFGGGWLTDILSIR